MFFPAKSVGGCVHCRKALLTCSDAASGGMNFERGIIIINILLLGMAANRDSINTTVFEEKGAGRVGGVGEGGETFSRKFLPPPQFSIPFSPSR